MSALLEHREAFPMQPTVARPAERPHALPHQPLVRTGRLTLRRPNGGDAEAMTATLSHYEVAKMLTRVPQPYHLEDALDRLASISDDAGGGWCFAVTLGGIRAVLDPRIDIADSNPDSRLIGFISVEWRGMGDRLGWHIGYWLEKSQWGKGLMSEAVNAVLARFFASQMGDVLFSSVMVDNTASLHIQQKLGFDITGVEECYSHSRGSGVRLITTELTFGGYMPR